MKKVIVAILMTASIFALSGCTSECTDKHDQDIEIEKYPINVAFTSSWDVKTYNGYECTNYSSIKNDDGTYTVRFTFTQLSVSK